MKFAKPLPFREAGDASRVKTLLPTSLSSAEIEQLVAKGHAEILERARFSAKVRSARHLDVIGSGADAILDGTSDFATRRLAIKQFLRDTGYMAPEEKRGGIEDFASTARTDLQLRMNVQMAQGYGYWQQGQNPDLLDAFPAREFLRVESREKERENWPQRWNTARAATTAEGATNSDTGRMVALVNHPIWSALSRFGQPYEPFDYSSGMGTEDVARSEAMELGIIDRDTQIPPEDRPFNADLNASPEIRSQRLRSLLESTGLGRFEGRVFVAIPQS